VQALGGVEAAGEVERRAAPAALHQLDAFLHPGAAVVAIGAEGLVVLQRAAAADADVEPAAAHHVEHRELLGQVHRMVQGQQAHAHAHPDRARPRGDVRREHGGGRAEPVVVEVVLGDPDRGVAEPLGGQHLAHVGVVDRLLAPLLVALHEIEQAEVHRARWYRPPRRHRNARA
jgi:hypothetical protein